jgi:5-formyltetrahydrofolate cyclo-ligase
MNDLKTTMRRHALARRDLVTQREAHDAAAAMCASALALVEKLSASGSAPVVSVYWPIRSELNTRPLIETLCKRGFRVALPILVAVKRPLLFRAFEPGDELAKGPFGLSEPSSDKAALEPDIIFAPLAAFDRKGYRLGYGGGLYDATLNALRAKHPVTAIGVAYAVQEADSIPIEDHDQKLDFIVTERETIRCA